MKIKLQIHDTKLIEIAAKTIKDNYIVKMHTIGAAIQTKNNHMYTAINIRTATMGICAEQIVIGMAFAKQEKNISSIVSVISYGDDEYAILPPCGSCRQLFVDYLPEMFVIVNYKEKLKAINLMIDPYISNFKPRPKKNKYFFKI